MSATHPETARRAVVSNRPQKTVPDAVLAALMGVTGEHLRAAGLVAETLLIDDAGIVVRFRRTSDGAQLGLRVEELASPGDAFRHLSHLRVRYEPGDEYDSVSAILEAAIANLQNVTEEDFAARCRAIPGTTPLQKAAGDARWSVVEHRFSPPGEHEAPPLPAEDASAIPAPPPAGSGVVEWASWMLGVDPEVFAAAGLAVAKITDDTVNIEVELRGGAGASYVVIVEPPDRSAPAFAHRVSYNVSYRPNEGFPKIESVLRAMTRAPASVPLDQMRRASAGEAAVSRVMPTSRSKERGTANRTGLHESWNNPDRWRVFFAEREMTRGHDGAVQTDMPMVRVEHGPDECHYTGHGDMIRYPWMRGRRDNITSAGSRAKRTDGADDALGHGEFVTDMTDNDVVHGSRAKVVSVLDLLRKRPNAGLIVVNHTCVPMMIGDDVLGAVKEARVGCSTPIVYRNQTPNPTDPFVAEYKRRIMAAPRVEPDPRAVNLLGFSNLPELDELTALLERFGVRVNARAVPRLENAIIERWSGAATQVVLRNSSWQHMLDEMSATLPGARTISPPPPYGLARTREWLRQVTTAAGLAESFEALVDGVMQPLASRFEALSKTVAGKGVGIVIDPEMLPRLREPELMFSLPLLHLLEEMGFTLRIAVYAPEGARPLPRDAFDGLFAEPGRHEQLSYQSREQLFAFLSRPDVNLVYSDFGYDHRIAAAGKTAFASDVFAAGAKGAVESLERLSDLCRLTFFREHGRYIGRAPSSW